MNSQPILMLYPFDAYPIEDPPVSDSANVGTVIVAEDRRVIRVIGAQNVWTGSPSDDQSSNDLDAVWSIVGEEKPTWEQLVSEAETRLQDAIEEAEDEDGEKPTDAAMVGACDMLDIADDLIVDHNVETYATSSCDVITDVTDFRRNYVVLKNKADGRVAVHYNINGYKEFPNQGQVEKGFVRSMLSALQHKPATT